MTDEEREPGTAAGGGGETDPAEIPGETATLPDADEALADGQAAALDDADELEGDDLADDEADDIDEEAVPVTAAAAAAGPAAATSARARRGQATPKVAAAPSVSEQAVHIDDRASAIFVIAIVGLFALIFVGALLVGPGSLFGNVLRSATPTPVVESASPSASPSGAPSSSASASASVAPSVSASAPASASPSAAASPSP